MKKLLKRVFALVLALGICLSCYQPMTVCADDLKMSEWGGPWTVSEGVTAYVEKGILYIKGTGDIPDYAYHTMYQRPWDGCIFQSVIIDEGIKNIGSYAFYGYWRLRYVTIPSTSFVRDNTTFGGIDNAAYIRITGSKVATESIGAIPFTSVMSIVRDAQNHPNYAYLIDYSYGWKQLLMTTTYPSLTNIYYANNADALKDRDSYYDPDFYNAGTYSSPLKYAPGYGVFNYSLRAMRKVQGHFLYQHFANFMAAFHPDYSWGTAYSVDAIGPNNKRLETTDTPQTFIFNVPADLQKAGRTFKVMILASNATGEVIFCDDMDASNTTVTFSTNKVGVSYALIYKDLF